MKKQVGDINILLDESRSKPVILKGLSESPTTNLVKPLEVLKELFKNAPITASPELLGEALVIAAKNENLEFLNEIRAYLNKLNSRIENKNGP